MRSYGKRQYKNLKKTKPNKPKLERYDETLAVCQDLIENSKNQEQGYMLKAEVHAMQRKWGKCIQDWKKVLEINSKFWLRK